MPDRRMSPRARAARLASADAVRRSAALLRDGEPLSDDARVALVELLEHLGGPACETVPTTVWDRTARLAQAVWEPHRRPLIDGTPPNVGGGADQSRRSH